MSGAKEKMTMRIRNILAVAALAVSLPAASFAAGAEGHVTDVSFSFEGPLGTFDQHQLQRGLQVYNEVCSACHGMKFVSFRSLGENTGPGYDPDQVNAIAALYEVADDSDGALPGDTRTAKASDKFPALSAPEPAYHGLKFHETFGNLAFTFHGIAIGLRDLGMTMNPQAAHYTLMGIETLSLRMQRHVENAEKVAAWLENDPRVDHVTYAGLPSSPYAERAKRCYPKGTGGLFTVALKGGYDACIKLVDSLEIFSHVVNLGDTRSLVIHSASTTHRQLTAEQQEAAGAGPNVVRISIGIEDADDLIRDLDQALAKASG